MTVPRVVDRAPLSDDGAPVRLFSDTLSGPSRPGETSDGQTLLLDRRSGVAREIWLRSVATSQERMVVSITDGAGAVNSSISPDGSRVGYTVTAVANEIFGTGFMVPVTGGVPTRVCERCMVYGFLSDNRRVLTSTEGRVRVVDTATLHSTDIVVSSDGGSFARVHASPDDRFVAFQHRGIFVTDLSLDAPRTPDRWHKVDDPAETGRPCGWSLDSRTLFLLLDTDGFRCLWGQRVDDRGAPIDAASPSSFSQDDDAGIQQQLRERDYA